MNTLEYVARQSQAQVLTAGLALVGLLGIIDYQTGWEFSFAIFYLIPVGLVAYSAGRGPGLLVSFVSALTWLTADTLCATPYTHAAAPYWNAGVRLGFFVLFTHLLASLRGALDQAWALAGADPLTGACNLRAFHQRVNAEIERARRYGRPLTVAYLDLDNFKTVNDQLGHAAGDFLLRRIAALLQDNIRKTDTVARLGGDEFALLLPEASPEAARAVLHKLHRLLADAMHQDGFPVTCSIGAVTFLRAPASSAELVREADERMYAVKRDGKNRILHEVLGERPLTAGSPHSDFAGHRAVRRREVG